MLDFGIPNMIKFEIFFLLKLFGCSDISFSSWLAGPCSLMPMVPQYCEAYFSDPFSYYLPPLSVCVVDTTIESSMYFLSCLWQLCCLLYRHLLTSTWCVFSKSVLVVLKCFEHFGWGVCCLCFEFSQKTANPRRFKQNHTQRGKKMVQKKRPVAATMLLFQGVLIQDY